MEKYRRILESNRELYLYTVTPSTEVPAASVENIDITAPVGYTLKPIAISFNIPLIVGATSGTNFIVLFNTSTSVYLGLMMSKTYAANMQMYYNDPSYNGNSFTPNDRAAWLEQLHNLLIQPGEIFRIQYQNSTDVSHTTTRTYRVLFEKIPVS